MATHADLINAVQAHDAAAIRNLLQQDSMLASAKDANGVSALMHAYYQRQSEIADLLVNAKPELDIFEATAAGKHDRVTQILKKDREAAKSWSPDGFTALHFAAFFNRPDIARDLVQAGADVAAVARNPMKVMPLHSAAAAHSGSIVRLLVENGAAPNVPQHGGWTPLHEAAQIGDLEMVKALVDHGADPNARSDDGRTPIDMAQAKGHDEVITLLRDAK